jgi:hypothetical protein
MRVVGKGTRRYGVRCMTPNLSSKPHLTIGHHLIRSRPLEKAGGLPGSAKKKKVRGR